MTNKTNKLLILIILLSSVVISLCIYFFSSNKEVDINLNKYSINVGDAPNADEVKRVIEGNIEKKIRDEAERKKYLEENPLIPITDLSQIKMDYMYISDVDPKLYVGMKEVDIQESVLDPKKIKVIYDLKNVVLCGETYKSKQIIVGGIDIIQRLSEILSKDSEVNDEFCNYLTVDTQYTGGIIKPGEEIRINLYKTTFGAGYDYEVSLGVGIANILSDIYKEPPYDFYGGIGGLVSVDKNIFTISGYRYKLDENVEL